MVVTSAGTANQHNSFDIIGVEGELKGDVMDS